MKVTPYQAKYFAHELTKRHASDSAEKLAGAVASAQVDLNPHQVDAALFAFNSPLAKGALLADEVGLGKTIEAGLVLSQKWAERKRRILIITPSNLRKQWFQEITEKFFLPCRILEAKSYNAAIRQGNFRPFESDEIVICSYHFACGKAADVANTPWDLVVIDEAHRLRNVYKPANVIANTLKRALANAPKLLLTATPLQNSLLELFGLVSFIDEHTFGDLKSFREQFANLSQEQVFQTLKSRLKPICHRTLRRQVTSYIPYTKRLPLVENFTPEESEDRLYHAVSNYLLRENLQALPASQRSLMTLVLRKLLASSTFAIAGALTSMAKRLRAKLVTQQPDTSLEEHLEEDYEALDETADEWEDGLEHSLWLSLIRDRLELLRRLLEPGGSCWVQLDDNEAHYCRVLMDEIFGRQNFVANVIWNKSYAVRSNAEFFSTAHEHILVYCKDRAQFNPNSFARTDKQEARYENPDNDPRGEWQSVTMTISLVGGARGRQYAKTGVSENIYEVTSPSGKKFLPPPNRCWSRSPVGFKALDKDNRLWWGPQGDRAPRMKHFLSESENAIIPTTLWADGDVFGLNQQGVREIRSIGLPDFPTPKPERLIAKVLELASNPGDLVLDSFAGTGTTGAVAHKMGRRWIMVELGEHIHTHIIPRMKKVIDGGDLGGVTEATGWKGGGGFRYFRLAPSLLTEDKWGNWVISKEYNPDMLAEAICKLEGFTYAPNDTIYWQQGYSTERDFLYITTAHLTSEQLQQLNDEVGADRSLLVLCTAFRGKPDRYANLTVRKIPKHVLARCEWGHDDYSLQVENLPKAPPKPGQQALFGTEVGE